MTTLSDFFLTMVLVYGPWAIGAVTLISGIGFPVPATMILMATGAFVQQGVLDWPTASLLAMAGAIAGDNISYMVGRFGGKAIPARIRQGANWQKAGEFFARWGVISIFLTRFLITPLALPINLMAGSTQYGLLRYASAVIAGEVLWVVLFVSGGYLFADYWEAISAIVSDFSGVLVGVVLLLISGAYLLHRHFHKQVPA